MKTQPDRKSTIHGSPNFPDIFEKVQFHTTDKGVLIVAELWNLPSNKECNGDFLAFHIHDGESCTGNQADPFFDTKTHYNPYNTIHPCHSGDLIPLLTNNGYTFEVFITNRFTVEEITGKAIIIHSKSDDFTTQPSGNAGEKIACGIIVN